MFICASPEGGSMKKKRNGGFTLVELVVAISIISIMSTLAVSVATGTNSLRARNADKMEIVAMNSIFTEARGADSFAYPQTAADIKLFLADHGYELHEPTQSDVEYWFDASNGRMCYGKVSGDKIVMDNGETVELKPNEKIIAADGFLSGYVYMGEKYRSYLDEFNSIDVDTDKTAAAARLTELLSDESKPVYIRKSLRTLAEHSIFIGSTAAATFTGVSATDAEDDDWFEFTPMQGTASDGFTVAVFTEKELYIEDQLKNSYIKSLYIPSDVTVTFAEGAFDDSWIQRVLVNKDVGYDKLENHSSQYDLTMNVSVLKNYYPSELPAYDLATSSIESFLALYDDKKEKSNEFADYRKNELVAKPDIDVLYNGFYGLRRPSDRRFVTKARPELYDVLTELHENAVELEYLYRAVMNFKPEEILKKGLTGAPENYALSDILDEIKSEKGNSAWDKYDKLFTDFKTDGVKLKSAMGQTTFTAEEKGEGMITLDGVLDDEIKIPVTVGGAYDKIDISGVKIGGSGLLTISGDKLGGEHYGTLDSTGAGVSVAPDGKGSGNFIHSAEKLVVSPVDATKATASGNAVKVTATGSDLTLAVKVSSYLDPNVSAICNVPLKGNVCNISSITDFNRVDKNAHGIAFHANITSTSSTTWKVPSGKVVYGNGYSFVNTTISPQDSAWASSNNEFRFPAALTVEGTVKNLKVSVKSGSSLGIANRFESIAEAENGDTQTTLANIKSVTVIEGKIQNNSWSGEGQYNGGWTFGVGKNKGKKYGSVYLLSKRLAAVRVYGSGTLESCFVEGGQYGIHLIGSASSLGSKLNLDKVYIKNALAAHIYISDNGGAMQYFAINDVNTYNESSLSPAFPILIEPKASAVSSKQYEKDRVDGYGISIKYRYDLLDNKINLNCKSLYEYNTIDKKTYTDMLYQNNLHNMQKITDSVKTDYLKEAVDKVISNLKLEDSFNIPITYGEQKFLQFMDQQCTFASDDGLSIGAVSPDKRNGYENFVTGYNVAAKRGTAGFAAAGTREWSLSYYAVPTNSGNGWVEPNIKP